MTEAAVETNSLTKRYGKRLAVDGLTISVPKGVVAGFVGPNGAGKTTTLAMLLGLVAPSGGMAHVLGEPLTDPAAYLGRVGALIERPSFYPGLTARKNLEVMATVGGHNPAEIPDLLELVGLSGRGDDRFGSYSMGMKQRLGIAAALLGDPALLLLDEPTNGLDPAGIREMRQFIGDLAEGGRTIFVSSHVLAELEQVCDWFVVINRGAAVFQGPASELLHGAATRLVVAPESPADLGRLQGFLESRGYGVTANGGTGLLVALAGGDPRITAARVNTAAMNEGVVLVELHVERSNLEDRYLSMVNGEGQ